MGALWRGRLVESSIQTQAGDEGDRVGEASAALEQFERCVGAISDGQEASTSNPSSRRLASRLEQVALL
jgi:hypothetical protein